VQGKKVIISFSISCIVLAVILSLVLVNMGQDPARALLTAAVLLVFLFIPIAGALRSIKRKEEDRSYELRNKNSAVIRPIVLFVLSPLLVGLIVFLTYPSTFITLSLILIVMVAASLFYFLTA